MASIHRSLQGFAVKCKSITPLLPDDEQLPFGGKISIKARLKNTGSRTVETQLKVYWFSGGSSSLTNATAKAKNYLTWGTSSYKPDKISYSKVKKKGYDSKYDTRTYEDISVPTFKQVRYAGLKASVVAIIQLEYKGLLGSWLTADHSDAFIPGKGYIWKKKFSYLCEGIKILQERFVASEILKRDNVGRFKLNFPIQIHSPIKFDTDKCKLTPQAMVQFEATGPWAERFKGISIPFSLGEIEGGQVKSMRLGAQGGEDATLPSISKWRGLSLSAGGAEHQQSINLSNLSKSIRKSWETLPDAEFFNLPDSLGVKAKLFVSDGVGESWRPMGHFIDSSGDNIFNIGLSASERTKRESISDISGIDKVKEQLKDALCRLKAWGQTTFPNVSSGLSIDRNYEIESGIQLKNTQCTGEAKAKFRTIATVGEKIIFDRTSSEVKVNQSKTQIKKKMGFTIGSGNLREKLPNLDFSKKGLSSIRAGLSSLRGGVPSIKQYSKATVTHYRIEWVPSHKEYVTKTIAGETFTSLKIIPAAWVEKRIDSKTYELHPSTGDAIDAPPEAGSCGLTTWGAMTFPPIAQGLIINEHYEIQSGLQITDTRCVEAKAKFRVMVEVGGKVVYNFTATEAKLTYQKMQTKKGIGFRIAISTLRQKFPDTDFSDNGLRRIRLRTSFSAQAKSRAVVTYYMLSWSPAQKKWTEQILDSKTYQLHAATSGVGGIDRDRKQTCKDFKAALKFEDVQWPDALQVSRGNEYITRLRLDADACEKLTAFDVWVYGWVGDRNVFSFPVRGGRLEKGNSKDLKISLPSVARFAGTTASRGASVPGTTGSMKLQMVARVGKVTTDIKESKAIKFTRTYIPPTLKQSGTINFCDLDKIPRNIKAVDVRGISMDPKRINFNICTTPTSSVLAGTVVKVKYAATYGDRILAKGESVATRSGRTYRSNINIGLPNAKTTFALKDIIARKQAESRTITWKMTAFLGDIKGQTVERQIDLQFPMKTTGAAAQQVVQNLIRFPTDFHPTEMLHSRIGIRQILEIPIERTSSIGAFDIKGSVYLIGPNKQWWRANFTLGKTQTIAAPRVTFTMPDAFTGLRSELIIQVDATEDEPNVEYNQSIRKKISLREGFLR